MLSYQHGYHAGNPADVHKHFILWTVTQRLQQKTSAIHFFDTHAGRGWYDLQSAQAQKNNEFHEGISRFLHHRAELIQEPQGGSWRDFFAVLDNAHEGPVNAETIRFYPGSPAWISQLRREQDRHTVFELHPTELDELQAMGEQRTGRVIFGDGLRGIIQQLPPKTPRLFILIDPAYEDKSEYQRVAETVNKALKRCRHAVILVWYPLLPAARHEHMLAALQQNGTPCMRSEFIYKIREKTRGMYGSGILVFNPPWQFEQELENAFAAAQGFYSLFHEDQHSKAQHRIDWLTPEA